MDELQCLCVALLLEDVISSLIKHCLKYDRVTDFYIDIYSIDTHTHTHTHTCTSIFVRILIGIMHSLAPYPNFNHHNWVPKPDPNLNLILTITLKLSLNPQNVIWRCLKKWGPAKMSSLSQNVLTLLVKYFFWSLLCSKYKCVHTHTHSIHFITLSRQEKMRKLLHDPYFL